MLAFSYGGLQFPFPQAYDALMRKISTNELRELYQKFFESKGHVRIPSAPLVPENDPSVLFTTAGMHPLVPYLKGQPHPAGKRLTDVQKSLRTTDIDEVGDATHATVFEMLGNWSLGDYFKKEAIAWSYEFLTSQDWLGINPNYLAVSIFAGNESAPRDDESAAAWKNLGIPEGRNAYLGVDDNWWPTGGKQVGPQGPDTEMFFWTGKERPPEKFGPSDKRWVEIWNDVFLQFNRDEKGNLRPLPQQNVDTGMGLERMVMILNGSTSIYEIDSFQPLMKLISDAAKQPDVRHARILADHIKAATFILADEHPVEPSNTQRGYVLRRIIRRAVRSARQIGIEDPAEFILIGQKIITEQYQQVYSSLQSNFTSAQERLRKEIEKFESILDHGRGFDLPKVVSGSFASSLATTHGFPVELTKEMALEQGKALSPNFDQEFAQDQQAHQQKSRTAAAGLFKGGLADHSEKSVHYHTATHLLHQALRDVLGRHVFQKGSNITPERLRFDFSHTQKMSPEEIQRVEETVNEKIQADLPVQREEMTVAEAKAKGALGLFEGKYGDRVSVYVIGNYSKEICGGPHVNRTGELGQFKILKEESAGGGIRRIKAVLK